MARLRPSLFLLLCCVVLVQRSFAEPRPEFGSAGTVQSSLTIRNTVNSITPLLAAVDDKNGLQVKTTYTVFLTVLPLMESLGTQVATLGPPVTTAIIAGIPKADGNYDGVFDPIIAAITAFKNFLTGEATTTRATLKQLLGDDIDHLFGDVFGNMRNALSQLETTLLRLKGALKTAVIRSGRAQVDPTIVTDVLVAASFLKATVTPVEYTIQSTIDNIKYGDSFLFDLESMNTALKSNLETYTTQFAKDLTDNGELLKAVTDTVKTSYKTITDALPGATSNIASLPEFQSGVQLALDKYTSGYSALSAMPDKITSLLTNYLAVANTYFTQYTDVLVPRSYDAIIYLLKVLIAGGPHSRFCFFKYSPRLTNFYALLVSEVEVCYNQESFRLIPFEEIAKSYGKLILFDVEDLIDNLTACNVKASPASCLTAIGPLYIALAEKTLAKGSSLVKLATAESTASLNRLGSCVLTNRLKNMQALISAVTDVKTCHNLGPQDPN
uniref:Secreted protein n=1 Tax=Anopheles maculatus TaxID=74869 RepID=A0A182SA94_9DIPT